MILERTAEWIEGDRWRINLLSTQPEPRLIASDQLRTERLLAYTCGVLRLREELADILETPEMNAIEKVHRIENILYRWQYGAMIKLTEVADGE